ncbi:recombinase family protein [Brucella sp. HL-2]|nr:recombinase family protein [Brucella sp. HL-2]MCV9910385.1 recombinase family protein [Brucella sp. HL-2]
MSISNTPIPKNGASNDEPLPAAAYVRMSTELQKYSTENQLAAIEKYADERNYKIVKIYKDAGKSGLGIAGRNALKQLIDDVTERKATFKVILVYDVSRWGRFQNADESAYYEYLCSRTGIVIHYCAEQFENDGSLGSDLLKFVRRVTAGDYSRDLSVKVFAGQCRLIELGFRQGGPAGFGLRRMMIDEHGTEKDELKPGQRKSLQTDRVILIPGPKAEIDIVNRIFRSFVDDGLSERQIAESLNAEGILSDRARPWTLGTIRQILTNEKYIGNNVYNKTSAKLQKRRVKNKPDIWVRADAVFRGIVPHELFEKAQVIFHERSQHLSDEELLHLLKESLARKGIISGFIIDEIEELPSSSVYRRRFGSLLRVYELIGYDSGRDYRYIEINRELRRQFSQQLSSLCDTLSAIGASAIHDAETDLLHINEEFCVSVVIARCRTTAAGRLHWKVRLDTGLLPDITIVMRMDEDNRNVRDYYLLPSIDIMVPKLRLLKQNPFGLEAYRFSSLDFFFDLARRIELEDVA